MTRSQREPFPFVTNVISLLGDWLKQHRELDRADAVRRYVRKMEPVAHELDVTPVILDRLVRQGRQGANELPYTLTALGIDDTALWRADPALLHAMEHACSFCTHKRRCHRELAAGTAATNYVEYCENADAIDTLRFRS
jgi:hypothetical protein